MEIHTESSCGRTFCHNVRPRYFHPSLEDDSHPDVVLYSLRRRAACVSDLSNSTPNYSIWRCADNMEPYQLKR